MSSPAQPRVLLRQSLYIWVLLAMVGILSLSYVAFRAISEQMQTQKIDPVYDRFDEMQLESARNILQSSGEPALKNYLDSLNRIFGRAALSAGCAWQRYGLRSQIGRRCCLRPPAVKSRISGPHEHWEITHRSQDGKFWFAAEGQSRPPRIWSFLPYYFLVIGATGILCWIAAAGVISPIRQGRNEHCVVRAGQPERARGDGPRR